MIGHKFPSIAIDKLQQFFDKVPDSKKPIFKRVFESDCTPRNAIKAKCYDCCGFEDIPLNVHSCKAYTCPLWIFRPVSSISENESED